MPCGSGAANYLHEATYKKYDYPDYLSAEALREQSPSLNT